MVALPAGVRLLPYQHHLPRFVSRPTVKVYSQRKPAPCALPPLLFRYTGLRTHLVKPSGKDVVWLTVPANVPLFLSVIVSSLVFEQVDFLLYCVFYAAALVEDAAGFGREDVPAAVDVKRVARLLVFSLLLTHILLPFLC